MRAGPKKFKVLAASESPWRQSSKFKSSWAALVALLCTMLNTGPALAQRAPEGNAHPTTRAVSEFGGANPFGDPRPSTFDLDKKRAFAAAVDLDPLRALGLFDGQRVKTLDTLARETVKEITGRHDYVDLRVSAESGKAAKLHYDPLFTFLDLVIDPGYYADKALIYVDYLPLREQFLDRLFKDKDQWNWWRRLGRLKPADILRVWEDVRATGVNDAQSQRAMGEMMRAWSRYQGSWRNLIMVAPAEPGGDWRHVSELSEGTPARAALLQLGDAWRTGDAARANAAVKTLAAELPKVNAASGMYPTSRLALERTYNKVNAFEWGIWIYALALVTLLLAFGTGRRWLAAVGVAALAGAVGLHGFGFVARCLIAERFAIQNQFESMAGLSLFAAVVGTVIMIGRRQWLFGAAAAGVGFMVLITATQKGIPGSDIEREAAILNTSVLLKYHVTTVLTSYGLISLGFMVSLFYLGTYYAAKLRGRIRAGSGEPALAGTGGGAADAAIVGMSAHALGLGDDAPTDGAARVLHDLDKSQMIILQLAFWGLGVGILLGAWWADHSWGRWWAFDPKELWALVTWLVYLVVIHVRVSSGTNRALLTAWLSVLGFFVMLWTYFGVNLLLPGLHAYA